MDNLNKGSGTAINCFLTAESVTDEFLLAMNDRIRNVERKHRRIYFDVSNGCLCEVAEYLFNEMHCRLSTATASERFDSLEVLYHFSFDPAGIFYCARVTIEDKTNPQMNSIAMIIKGAEWIEREIHDLFGIVFAGHPKPDPLLTGSHPQGIKIPLRYKEII